jgi:cytidyltransferase-like protein
MENVVLITGGFDPIHSGHIAYIKEAKKLGGLLIVGVNSDDWLIRKKGTPFMPLIERQTILASIKEVDEVIVFNDTDGSAKDAILQVRKRYPNTKIVFGNGGDRTKTNIPEMDLPEEHLPFVKFVFGVGGEDKRNSSSWILEKWKVPKTKKFWYIWSKALGEKAHEDRATADKIALIRTCIVLVYVITNFFITANIILNWVK